MVCFQSFFLINLHCNLKHLISFPDDLFKNHNFWVFLNMSFIKTCNHLLDDCCINLLNYFCYYLTFLTYFFHKNQQGSFWCPLLSSKNQAPFVTHLCFELIQMLSLKELMFLFPSFSIGFLNQWICSSVCLFQFTNMILKISSSLLHQ